MPSNNVATSRKISPQLARIPEIFTCLTTSKLWRKFSDSETQLTKKLDDRLNKQ
jgi:hypothetical protein